MVNEVSIEFTSLFLCINEVNYECFRDESIFLYGNLRFIKKRFTSKYSCISVVELALFWYVFSKHILPVNFKGS